MKISIYPFYTTTLGSLYCGDCLKVMDFLIEKGIKVDAIVTDPPYAVTQYKWDQIIPFNEMWNRLLQLIKPTGAIVLCGNEPFSSALRQSNEKMYRYDWKWIKTQVTGFQNAKYQPLRCYEDLMVFSQGGAVSTAKSKMCYYPQDLISVNLKKMHSTVDYLKEKKDKTKTEYTQEFENYPRNVIQFSREATLYHPTQKPISLMSYIISTYSQEGELILDFTSGSGTIALACEMLSRKWIAIEISEKYCTITQERIKNGIQLKLGLEYPKNQN